MNWKNPYTLSKDYKRLYDLVVEGNEVACFIDFDWDRKGDIVRDICKCRRVREFDIHFGCRGVGYASVDRWHKEGPLNELEVFVKICTASNVEFIDVQPSFQNVMEWARDECVDGDMSCSCPFPKALGRCYNFKFFDYKKLLDLFNKKCKKGEGVQNETNSNQIS